MFVEVEECCTTSTTSSFHFWGPGYETNVTRWMHDIVGQAWVSAHAEHGPVACIWLLSECDWTSGYRISHKKYTHVQHRNCESGLAKACCTLASATHTAGHVEMAWTDESHRVWQDRKCYSKWSVQASKQTSIPMHKHSEVTAHSDLPQPSFNIGCDSSAEADDSHCVLSLIPKPWERNSTNGKQVSRPCWLNLAFAPNGSPSFVSPPTESWHGTHIWPLNRLLHSQQ